MRASFSKSAAATSAAAGTHRPSSAPHAPRGRLPAAPTMTVTFNKDSSIRHGASSCVSPGVHAHHHSPAGKAAGAGAEQGSTGSAAIPTAGDPNIAHNLSQSTGNFIGAFAARLHPSEATAGQQQQRHDSPGSRLAHDESHGTGAEPPYATPPSFFAPSVLPAGLAPAGHSAAGAPPQGSNVPNAAFQPPAASASPSHAEAEWPATQAAAVASADPTNSNAIASASGPSASMAMPSGGHSSMDATPGARAEQPDEDTGSSAPSRDATGGNDSVQGGSTMLTLRPDQVADIAAEAAQNSLFEQPAAMGVALGIPAMLTQSPALWGFGGPVPGAGWCPASCSGGHLSTSGADRASNSLPWPFTHTFRPPQLPGSLPAAPPPLSGMPHMPPPLPDNNGRYANPGLHFPWNTASNGNATSFEGSVPTVPGHQSFDRRLTEQPGNGALRQPSGAAGTAAAPPTAPPTPPTPCVPSQWSSGPSAAWAHYNRCVKHLSCTQ